MTTGKRRKVIAVAAVAAVAVLVPTLVYAYKSITASVSETAPYQNTISIQGASAAKGEQLSETKDKYMMYKLEYIPEGFVLGSENSAYEGKYHNDETGGGITPVFYRIPAKDDFKINLDFSEKCENYGTDGKTAMVSYRPGYGTKGEDAVLLLQ